jgi:hypothetical protein
LKKIFAFASLFGLIGLSSTYAVTITSTGTEQPVSGAATLSGFTQIATVSGTFPFPGSPDPLTATYTDSVWRNNTTGFLDFVIQVTNTTDPSKVSSSQGGYQGIIESISDAAFSGFTTDADYVAGTGTCKTSSTDTTCPQNPSSVSRSFSVTPLGGSNVKFYFSTSPLGAGSTSPELVIATNALFYDENGTVSAQDGSAAGATAFEPTSAPEPATIALFGGGFALLGLARIRSNRKTSR